MSDKQDKTPKNIKVELGGMGLYGTTSNQEIAGYKMSGDIENAGQLDKGFKKENGSSGAKPSLDEHNQRD
ncbi:hypothetical protein SAMN05216389_110122 [Oceanobacillus limi]|uniref:Uncharacterized protein n=1 Tax=Oceanobacillus limi TaxID=930131 RepID=A0A1I0E5H8_9BACI|nr:hypothetical protein [Oceanobacillus limi]SET40166.1 hypothetical protein SAMN05216389_110122 [Oceanobacillus limi]